MKNVNDQDSAKVDQKLFESKLAMLADRQAQVERVCDKTTASLQQIEHFTDVYVPVRMVQQVYEMLQPVMGEKMRVPFEK